jgi:hypothetical protein
MLGDIGILCLLYFALEKDCLEKQFNLMYFAHCPAIDLPYVAPLLKSNRKELDYEIYTSQSKRPTKYNPGTHQDDRYRIDSFP